MNYIDEGKKIIYKILQAFNLTINLIKFKVNNLNHKMLLSIFTYKLF